MAYWTSGKREIDFVLAPNRFVEVKRGRVTALEYSWFGKAFPRGELVVIGANEFESGALRGMTMESFLQGG
ncbi:MAG: hypothetical protein HY906_25450 [Deltaproteobacteria bacterium]|nr:hypothetical protein [Deltaproteobacteria bacterium]